VLYHLKIFYVDADEEQSPGVRVLAPAQGKDCNWMSSLAMNRAFADSAVIIRIRASWSSRG
jgi:hypothetical protein